MTKFVLVLNHFAVPRGRPGGTRHVELFGRLREWRYLVIASELNQLTGEKQSAEPGFRPVRVAAYDSNGWRRILNWVSYTWFAFWVGVRQRGVDIVYASSPHLLAALTGWAISRIRRVPFVLEVRDLWPKVLVDMGQLSESSPIYKSLVALEQFLYRSAKMIVVMAEGTRTDLIARGTPQSKIVYIPNGADPSDFVPSRPRAQLRAEYGFERLTAVYAGAHGPANGLDFVLAAAADLTDIPLDIILVGGGVQKSALQAQVVEQGLKNVQFWDPVPKDEIPDILAAADVGLHVLADVELFQTAVSPNKVFDYMAAGLPVLTNTPGEVASLVMGAGAGIAVAPTEIAAGLRVFFGASDSTRKSYGDRGKLWIEDHQSRSSMASRLEALLDKCA